MIEIEEKSRRSPVAGAADGSASGGWCGRRQCSNGAYTSSTGDTGRQATAGFGTAILGRGF